MKKIPAIVQLMETMSGKKYIVHGKCQKDADKKTCGDFLLYREISDEGIVVLVMADGVGSRHHDFIASNNACNAFVDSFLNNQSGNMIQRFETALKKADHEVSSPLEPAYHGMMSVFLAVVWNTNENYFLWDCIGDSRLYKYSAEGLIQISLDGKKAVNMRDKSGKLLIQDGVLVIREGLTNALGYNGARISVKRQDFHEGESLVLCTDGMYEIDDFDGAITGFLSSGISEKRLEKFFSANRDYFKDDASMLILQRTDQPQNYEQKYQEVIRNGSDYRQFRILPHLITNYIQPEMLRLVKEKNETGLKIFAAYIAEHNLLLTEDFINKAIQEMKATDYINPDFYHLLIRQLKKINW
ncbi:MAG TPA: protein phosphatase 2C domain-containing protein [Bacteroidales bacterium]|nr:protein phosphatase 2C domain-containing protein [Bacteroidales bacterium]